MIRHLLVSSASAIALFASVPALAQGAEAPATPQMSFGEWGVDTSQIDPNIDPGANFFDYVNSRWVASNEIPADRSSFGTFAYLAEQATVDVEKLITGLEASNPAPGTQARRVLDAYNAYLDTDAIEAAGLAPAQPYLQEIFSAPDLESLVRLFEEPGYPGLVSVGVGVDRRAPDTHIASVGFSAMGLPDRDYYLVDSERNTAVRAAYMTFLETMLGEAGYEDPAAAAQAVYAFEKQVATLEWDRRVLRIPELTYNILSRDELAALAPGFPTMALLESGDYAGVERFSVSQIPPTDEEIVDLELSPEQLALIGGGLPAMMQLLTQTPLATVKAFMATRFLSSNASVLPKRIDDANFAFYGTALSGSQQQQPRWKRGIASTEGLIGEQVGQLYVAEHFPPEAKQQMEELVANLQGALRESLGKNDWMTPETTARAVAKLDAFVAMIGYPDEFETYDGLEIRADDPLGNRIRAIDWAIKDNRSDLGEPVDKTEWGMLPQTVNAYYSPSFNQIVFPAAILQAPFFNPDADPAVNYGAIGAVIGHEIGHGFDDNGSQYDADGALRNWWQDDDRQAFEAEADKLKAMISAYCPFDEGTFCLRGDQGIGETIGDVSGLQLSYAAYRRSLDGKEAPVIDGLTGDQRFFLGFAQIWRDMYREEALRNRILTAPHPPAQFRVNNTVRHNDAWYEAFNVTPEDPLYLPPEERVQIW